MHVRRDYKVTMKGLKQLLPHHLEHPKDIHDIDVYMDKIKLDKRPFTLWLSDIAGSVAYLVNLHQKDREDIVRLKVKDGKFISTEYKRK